MVAIGRDQNKMAKVHSTTAYRGKLGQMVENGVLRAENKRSMVDAFSGLFLKTFHNRWVKAEVRAIPRVERKA